MCVNLVIKYDCGHESGSNIPCDNKRCKKAEGHNRTKQHSCRDCLHEQIRRLRRERDEERQKAQDAKSASTKMLQQQKFEHEKQSKALADRCIHVYLTTTFARGHDVEEVWDCDAAEDTEAAHHVYIRQDTHSTSDKDCTECQEQEEANRDEAYARLTRAHAAETQTVQELREQIEEIGDVWLELEGLRQERDELAERLDMVEGEVVADLRELLLDSQCQSEDIDTQLNILAVQQTEFMREMDEQNADTDIAILQLGEELRTAFLQYDEWDSDHEIDLQEVSIKQARSEDLGLIISPNNSVNEGEQLREAAGADVADVQVSGHVQSRDKVAATEDICRNEPAFEATAVIEQVPKIKPGKPPKPPKPIQLSSASGVDLGDTPVRPDGLRDVMKELVDTRWRRQK